MIIISCVVLFLLAAEKSSIFIGRLGMPTMRFCLFSLLWAVSDETEARFFSNPSYDPQGAGYHQLRLSLIAIGLGASWGKGFGIERAGPNIACLPNRSAIPSLPCFPRSSGFVGSLFLLCFVFIFPAQSDFPYLSGRRTISVDYCGPNNLLWTDSFLSAYQWSRHVGDFPCHRIPLVFVSNGRFFFW